MFWNKQISSKQPLNQNIPCKILFSYKSKWFFMCSFYMISCQDWLPWPTSHRILDWSKNLEKPRTIIGISCTEHTLKKKKKKVMKATCFHSFTPFAHLSQSWNCMLETKTLKENIEIFEFLLSSDSLEFIGSGSLFLGFPLNSK